MILPDTSVWIDFFKDREPISTKFSYFLESGQLVGVSWIFGELLQGSKSSKETSLILDFWNNISKPDPMLVDLIWIEAGKMSQKNKFYAKGIGLIDCAILAASMKLNAKVWTLDRKLEKVIPVERLFATL